MLPLDLKCLRATAPAPVPYGAHVRAFSIPKHNAHRRHASSQAFGAHASQIPSACSALLSRRLGQVDVRNFGRCVSTAATPAPAAQTASADTKPNLVLEHPETGTVINVFGVEHLRSQAYIGDYILQQRPQAVVVETAVGTEHGALPGNTVSCSDQLVNPQAAFYMRMFCQVAASLKDQKDAYASSPLWQQVSTSYNGEQLAYIAALTVGAPLVFGDRPKDITYRRIFGLTSLKQLDEAFDWQATANYRALLGQPPPTYAPEALPVVEQIMMLEREAVMLQVAQQLCTCSLAQVKLTQTPKNVVMVVGASHLPGLEYLWRSGRWREVTGWKSLSDGNVSGLLSAPQRLPSASDPDYGLRRGLFEAVLRLSVTREVMDDISQVLGPVPPQHQPAYDAVTEIYGSFRMQLAALPRELLQQVVLGNQCDFYEVLDNLRQIRPINGGPGYSLDMVTFVRALNFELD